MSSRDSQKDPVCPFKENSGFMMTPKDLDQSGQNQRTRHTLSCTVQRGSCLFHVIFRITSALAKKTHNMTCSEKGQNKWRDVAEATWKAGGPR